MQSGTSTPIEKKRARKLVAGAVHDAEEHILAAQQQGRGYLHATMAHDGDDALAGFGTFPFRC